MYFQNCEFYIGKQLFFRFSLPSFPVTFYLFFLMLHFFTLPPLPISLVLLFQCQLYRNVCPLLYDEPVDQQEWLLNVERMLQMGIDKGKKEGFISEGSSVVLLSGWRPDPDHINTIRIIKVEQCNH